MKEAILIDAYAKTISKVEFNNLDDLKKMMKVNGPVTVAVRDGDNGELLLMVDDEGLFKEGSLPGFQYEGYPQTLVGSGAIVQSGEDGEEVPITAMSLDDIRNKVTFTTMLDSARQKIVNTPPVIKGFDTVDDLLNEHYQPLKNRKDFDEYYKPKTIDDVFQSLKRPTAGASTLRLFKAFAEHNKNNMKEPRLIFLNKDLFGETVSLITGVLRPGSAMKNKPTQYGGIASVILGTDSKMKAESDPRPFFLGEPFESLWIECLDEPIFGFYGNGMKEPGKDRRVANAIYLWRSTEDVYVAVMVGADGYALSTIMSDSPTPDDSQYELSAVHCFLFHLFQVMAKKGQLGTERVNERFRTGEGKDRRLVKIKDIVHVRLRRKESVKSTGVSEPSNIEWSHRWEVMGHWRKVNGIGKDDRNRYHVQGYTWVKSHTKGPEDKEIVKKTRLVLDSKK